MAVNRNGFKNIIIPFALLLIPQLNAYSQNISAAHAMVATDQHYATQVGIDILKKGGNAIDAAAAIGYALAVVHPCCGNLGGGGFMTIRFANGATTFINFREKAPSAAHKELFIESTGSKKQSLSGYLTVAVPGSVMGLNWALKKYGTMPLNQIIDPAIHLAEDGFVLGNGDIEILHTGTKYFRNHTITASIFLKNNHEYHVGDYLIQKNLANSLKQIAKQGSDFFYHGPIADEVVKSSNLNGGILSKDDFATYNIEEISPVTCQYHEYTIVSAPPPSSGGVTLCEMLNIIKTYPLSLYGYKSARTIHYIAEAMRNAYEDRNYYLGDPDFVSNPIKHLLSEDFAKRNRYAILNYFAPLSDANNTSTIESMHTTHYSVVDSYGNAVAVTYTINSYFGAKVMAENTGFFLNNEMDDFTTQLGVPNQFGLIQGKNNLIAPGKRPLSTMTPTIVLKNNKLFLVLGSPGGSTIITTILETLLNVTDYGMTIQQAVNEPRFHFQGQPNVIYFEPQAISFTTQAILHLMGYRLMPRESWGSVQAIMIDPEIHALYGANDRRRPASLARGF